MVELDAIGPIRRVHIERLGVALPRFAEVA
jgi:hypothetical protein